MDSGVLAASLHGEAPMPGNGEMTCYLRFTTERRIHAWGPIEKYRTRIFERVGFNNA